jgi:hypothetical protein
MLPKKTSLAIISFGALMLFLEVAKFARPFSPDAALDFRPRTTTVPEEAAHPRPQFIAPNKAPSVVGPNLIDPHESLKTFYQALWRTEAREPGAVTRILHYGDSPVTADSITADVRATAGTLRRCRPWIRIDRQTLGLVWTSWRGRARQRLAH